MNINQVSDKEILDEFSHRFASGTGNFITSSDNVLNHIRAKIVEKDKSCEQVYLIYLNGRNEIISTELLFTGSLTTATVYPREIVKSILGHEAAAIVMVHNHPSGNEQPSKDDITITKKVKEACNVIDVVLHDHILITLDGSSYSLGDHGLL